MVEVKKQVCRIHPMTATWMEVCTWPVTNPGPCPRSDQHLPARMRYIVWMHTKKNTHQLRNTALRMLVAPLVVTPKLSEENSWRWRSTYGALACGRCYNITPLVDSKARDEESGTWYIIQNCKFKHWNKTRCHRSPSTPSNHPAEVSYSRLYHEWNST